MRIEEHPVVGVGQCKCRKPHLNKLLQLQELTVPDEHLRCDTLYLYVNHVDGVAGKVVHTFLRSHDGDLDLQFPLLVQVRHSLELYQSLTTLHVLLLQLLQDVVDLLYHHLLDLLGVVDECNSFMFSH